MKLLAIDTSSIACSVALQLGGTVSERHVVEAKIHTRTLIPMIRELLAEAAIDVTDLDALVIGNGPGSFIGMRIGASVVQGLAYAAGLNVIPVSSLVAVAAEAMESEQAAAVAVTQDARMHEVYLGCFEKAAGGLPRLLGNEVIHPIATIDLMAQKDVTWIAAGAGWNRFPDLQMKNGIGSRQLSPVQWPRARFLLPSAIPLLENGDDIPPDRLQPSYLRSQVATPPTA